jgi:hypothetical protein
MKTNTKETKTISSALALENAVSAFNALADAEGRVEKFREFSLILAKEPLSSIELNRVIDAAFPSKDGLKMRQAIKASLTACRYLGANAHRAKQVLAKLEDLAKEKKVRVYDLPESALDRAKHLIRVQEKLEKSSKEMDVKELTVDEDVTVEAPKKQGTSTPAQTKKDESKQSVEHTDHVKFNLSSVKVGKDSEARVLAALATLKAKLSEAELAYLAKLIAVEYC